MEQDPWFDEQPLVEDPADVADVADVEPAMADAAARPQRVASRPVGRLGVSIPGAIGAAILVTAIAFGAAARIAGSPAAPTGGSSDGGADAARTQADDTTVAEPDGNIGGDGETGGADAGETADLGDGPDASEPDATEPAPPAAPTTIAIALHLGDAKVKVEWGACPVDGFAAWKIVRTLDGKPTWPLGDGDRLAAASENPDLRTVAIGDLPAGKTLYVRVFALVERDGQVVVGCRSAIEDIRIPAPEPTPEPTPKPTPEPDPIGSIGLVADLADGGKPHLDWTTCPGDWDAMKVVRSTNDGVSYPLGSGDALAGAFGKDGATAMTDGGAAAGRSYWYRVFCVRASGDGWQVVAQSPIRKVTTPAAEPIPEPDPVDLGLSVELTDGGAVGLHWEACTNEHFVAYKIIRSAGPDPSYLPATDGSQVIAVKESAGATWFTDTNVESGQTWFYRVQCIGWMNDHKVLLGETDAVSVSLP